MPPAPTAPRPVTDPIAWAVAATALAPSRRRHPARGGAAARLRSFALVALCAVASVAWAADTTPARQLERFAAEAGNPGLVERGRAFFAARHGGEWACASCHGEPPVSAGKHASTGKAIDPLAPSVNPAALTDRARVDKWFRRNCRDVLQRECSAQEKADVVAYLIALGSAPR